MVVGGAGIRSRDAGSLLLDGVRVNNNHSTGVAIGDYGGGIYVDDVNLTITGESLVYGNSAAAWWWCVYHQSRCRMYT